MSVSFSVCSSLLSNNLQQTSCELTLSTPQTTHQRRRLLTSVVKSLRHRTLQMKQWIWRLRLNHAKAVVKLRGKLGNAGERCSPSAFRGGNAVLLAQMAVTGRFRDTTRDSETEPLWTLWNTEKPTTLTLALPISCVTYLCAVGLCYLTILFADSYTTNNTWNLYMYTVSLVRYH